MYAVITLIMQDWLIIHVSDDFLGNGGRIFTKRVCDFIESFVFVQRFLDENPVGKGKMFLITMGFIAHDVPPIYTDR